ncbi:MAG: hypothetical protein QM669_10055 [Siphonobacter sp.]
MVLLYQIQTDSVLVSYATTNPFGQFQLSFQRDTLPLLLFVNSLGYEAQYKSITLSDTLREHLFRLDPLPIELKQVEVKAHPLPIRKQGDTTSYWVQRFGDGSEKVIEDLLKKLPGIEVNEDGSISFKGKAIDKILIEGEEFFSKNYRLISKNLSANVLERVDAIENTPDSPLLKGLVRSDKTVLNLVLRSDHRKAFFGNADIGYGSRNRYDFRGNGFSLMNRLKLGIIGTGNNVGRNPVPGIEEDLSQDKRQKSNVSTQPFIANATPFVPGLPLERYNLNQVNVGAFNINYALSTTVKLKAFTYRMQDRNTQQISTQNAYLTTSTPLTVIDTQGLVWKPRVWNTQVELDVQPSSTTSWKWRSTWQNQRNLANYAIVSQNPEQTEQLVQNSRDQYHSLQHSLSFIHRFTPQQAFQFEGTFLNRQRPQVLNVFSDRFAELFGVGSDSARQAIQHHTQLLDIRGKWLNATLNKHQISLGIGGVWSKELLVSQLALNRTQAPLDYQNETSYSQSQGFLEASYLLPWRRWEIQTNVRLGGQSLVVQDYLREERQSWDFLYLKSTIGLRYRLNTHSNLLALYARNPTQSTLGDVIQGYILNQYRTFQSGNSSIIRPKTDLYLINYTLVDWINQWNVWVELSYLKEHSPLMQSLSFTNLFTFYQQTKALHSNDSYTASLQWHKYLPFIETNLRSKASYDWGSYQGLIDKRHLTAGFIKTVQLGINASTAFDGFFNAELGFQYYLNQLIEENKVVAGTRILKPVAGIKMNLSSKWFFLVTGEAMYWRTDFGQNVFHFVDALIRFVPHKEKISLELTTKNILDSSNATFLTVNPLLISQRTYQLQSRYILLHMDFRF